MKQASERWLVIGLLLVTSAYAIAEEITLTTYYPSPRGVYNELRTMGTTLLAQQAGAVGIGLPGTAPPPSRLTVAGSGTGRVQLGDGGCGGNYAGIALGLTTAPAGCTNYSLLSAPDDSTLYLNRPGGATMRFRASNADQMVIDGSGNVGIGTAAPGAKLEVQGQGAFNNPGGVGVVNVSGSGDGAQYAALNLANTSGETWGLQYRQDTGNLTFGQPSTGSPAVEINPLRQLNVFGNRLRLTGVDGVNVAWIMAGEAEGSASPAGQNVIGWNGSPGFAGRQIFLEGTTVIGASSSVWGIPQDLVVTGNLTVNGVKAFQINHPLDPARKALVHSSLEGPEVGVYYRGEGQLADGKATIRLPDYFEALTRQEERTVLLTPRADAEDLVSMLAASAVTDGAFTVRAIDDRNPTQQFYWEVKAVRKDVPPLEVEPSKPAAE